MQNQDSSFVFDHKRASSYDERFEKLAPLRDALYLLSQLILSEVPANAQVLCVGAGTGSELLYLANAFPLWNFSVVEPAAPMLDICRRRAEENNIASRCTFHQGYLDSLPASNDFDAATCFLVSHFLTQPEERRNLFRQISSRLRPGGYLVSADLASDMSSTTYQSLYKIWLRMLEFSEIPDEEIETIRASYGTNVAMLPISEVETIISSGGFDTPVLFFQTLLVHAWYSRRIY